MPLLFPTPDPGVGTPTVPPPSEHWNLSSGVSCWGWNVRLVPSLTVHVFEGRFADPPSGNRAKPHAAATKVSVMAIPALLARQRRCPSRSGLMTKRPPTSNREHDLLARSTGGPPASRPLPAM